MVAQRPFLQPGHRPFGPATGPSASWAGTRIVEFGAGAAGPIATRYFAEHGATVIRIESASRPDFLRARGPRLRATCSTRSTRASGPSPSTSSTPRATPWRSASSSSGPTPSSRTSPPRPCRGLGLAHADLVGRPAGPRDGRAPASTARPGRTATTPASAARARRCPGFNYLTGWPDREPVGPFGTITDSLAPRFVATALAAALLHQRRHRRGRVRRREPSRVRGVDAVGLAAAVQAGRRHRRAAG